ncbi:type III PLP-dependent enzyme [Streptomyces sp. B8F3]|uniref:type III PLP-dependent enzyme n=1 Tax=unclassified Streptomyces TaxID=2593676 RepID=UPI00325F87EF
MGAAGTGRRGDGRTGERPVTAAVRPPQPAPPAPPVTTAAVTARLRAALAAAEDDRIIYDLPGIEERYDELRHRLPGVDIRFAMKSCPVGEVLARLAQKGAGFDAASPGEVEQALRAGAPAARVHFGNTVKSDRGILAAHRLGVRDFATDSPEDVLAIAALAPGARVFCRLATSGEGALWGLGRKFGCSPGEAVRVLAGARAAGLVPAGLSVHVGSQQMTAAAWRRAFDAFADVLAALGRRGIHPDHVNLGGGLPALGYRDLRGRPLVPELDETFAAIRTGMARLRAAATHPLRFVVEPGRHLVADHGAIRAHVARLSSRRHADGERGYWLFLSCGKFNGLYEVDQVQYPLVFPSHGAAAELVPAVVAGPTCDSDDVVAEGRVPVQVPRAAASGDPVWILSSGAYAVSYMTRGFNGYGPLPHTCLRAG